MLEARCTQFVIAHFINIVCCMWSSASLLTHSTYIHDDKCYEDVSEHYRDCNGNSSALVQGRRQLDLSGLCNTCTTLTYHDNVL